MSRFVTPLTVKPSPLAQRHKTKSADMEGKPCTPGHTEYRDHCVPNDGEHGERQEHKPDNTKRETKLRSLGYVPIASGKTKDGQEYEIRGGTIEGSTDDTYIVLRKSDLKEIGRAVLSGKGDYITTVRVDDEYQRQGIARTMYDAIEAKIGKPLRPSPLSQTPQAEALWRNRKAKQDWKQNGVKSQAFKNWFGDWEQDPDDASKIVDEHGNPQDSYPYSVARDDDGEPIVLYHGTTHDFEAFDPSVGNLENDMGKGFYFSSSYSDAEGNYAGEGPDLTSRLGMFQDRLNNEGIAESIESLLVENDEGDLPQFDEIEDAIRNALSDVSLISDIDKAVNALRHDYENEGLDKRSIAAAIARSQLVGEKRRVIKAYLNIRNPVVLGDWKSKSRDGTVFDYEYLEQDANGRTNNDPDFDSDTAEIIGETGSAAKLLDAVRDVANDYGVDSDAVVSDLMSPPSNLQGVDGKVVYGFDGGGSMTAAQAARVMKASDALVDLYDDNTQSSMSSQFVSDVFKRMGFDGVVYLDASKHFPNMGISPGTKHYIAWNPTQVKSVDNQGTFDPNNPNMNKMLVKTKSCDCDDCSEGKECPCDKKAMSWLDTGSGGALVGATYKPKIGALVGATYKPKIGDEVSVVDSKGRIWIEKGIVTLTNKDRTEVIGDEKTSGMFPTKYLKQLGKDLSHKHQYSSTQFNLENAGYNRTQGSPIPALQAVQDQISDDDLAEDGKEDNFHITVKYGLSSNDANEVREVVKQWMKLRQEQPGGLSCTATLGEVSLFPAGDSTTQRGGDQYDVVKVEVTSPDLEELNQFISDNLEHTDTHPIYSPHVTLAYVRPGMGKKYAGLHLNDHYVILHKLVFSDRDGEKTVIDFWDMDNSMKETFKEELGDVGDEDYLDTYRKENPKMSKLMDAHYTIALLAQKQNKSGTKFMEYKPRSMNYIGKDLSIAAYKDMSGQECTIGHNAARDNCIPKKKEPTSKKPSKQKEQVSSDYSTESDTDAIPEKQRAKAGKLVSARREGKGKDAVVILHGGKPAPEHIKPSMIPPAWKKVRVSLDPEADVLVTARDAKGRVKTVYHERFIANNQAAKFAKIQEGLKKFEQLSDEIQKDRSNPEFKEFADCAWLMQEQATRPGSDADTKGFEHLYGKKLTADDFLIKYDKKGKASIALQIGEEKIPMKDEGSREEILRRIKEGEDLDDSTYWLKSFGATTLEDRHVVETVDGVRLRFQGKEGVFHDHLIKNPELASMLLDRKKTAGDRDGKIFNTDYLGVSSYVKKLDGGMFTPKDLRTMRATSMAIAEIKKMGDCCKTPEEYEQRVMEVAEKVSHVLGNRAEQCLLSYISPTVWSVWKNPEPEESDDAVALAYEVPKPPKLENPSDAEKQMIQDLLKMATWKTSDPRIIPITRPMGEITNKPGPNQKKITAFRLKLVKWRRENAEHFVEKKSLGMWTKGLDLSVKEEESTNDIPGLDADIYFGDPSIPLPNWREVLPEEDDDSDEISDEERDAVERMIGFGSDDSDDDDSPYMPEIRPSPFDKHGKDLLNEDDMNKALPKTKKEPKLKVDLTGKPCGRGQSAARTHCKPKEKPAPRKPRATNPAVAKPIDKKPALVKPAVQKPVTVATKPATKKTIQPKKYTVAESDKLARSFYDKFAKSVLGSNAEKLQLDSLRDMLSRSTNAAIEFMGHNVFRISAHGKKSVMIDQIINGMQAAKKANQKPVVYDMEKIVPKPAPFKSMDDVINYLVSLSPKLDAMAQMKSKVENLTKKAKEIFNSANKEEVDKKLQMYEQRIKFINKVSQDFSKKVRDRLVEGLIVHSWSPPATDVNSFKKQMTKLFKNREGFDIDKAMAKFTPALEFINKAVRRSTHSNFKIVEASDKRSFYKKASVDGTRATIGVDPDFTEDYTFVHEVGHHLECNVPGLREAAVAFVKRRTAKSPNRKLKDLFPKAHYSDSETGNQDDFAKTFGESSSWYVGKTYALTDKGKKKEFTEIVSMGLQHLYTDPVGFAKSDPEYCALIINAMRGKV